MIRILVDGMGGDNAPQEIVKGAILASKEIAQKRDDFEITIIGEAAKIEAELAGQKYDSAKIKVRHASEVITGEDSPVKSIRRKKDSSLVVGLEMLKNGEGDLLLSAGNTGAFMAGGTLILGTIPGIERPAIASVYPVIGKEASLLVDAGANAECRAENLLEFATMGSIYMKTVLGRDNPRVGLLNIGTEPGKGNSLTKETYKLLEKSFLNFVGNVEAREVPYGASDVIVCDGFCGNVLLKLTEGLAFSIMGFLKKKFTEGPIAKLGAAMLLGKLKDIKAEFDYSEYGAAPILGVSAPILKMHGSSNAKAVKNAILRGIPYAEENVIDMISAEMEKVAEALEDEHQQV